MMLQEKLKMLPGRVAVLTNADPEQDGVIEVPGWVTQQIANLGLPPHKLVPGEVVAVGYGRTARTTIHPDDFKVGDRVAVMPLEGRIIHHKDEDHPDLGEIVPEGKQLRLYGALQDYSEQVLIRL